MPHPRAQVVLHPDFQVGEIDRVCREHAALSDDAFVRANLERWLS